MDLGKFSFKKWKMDLAEAKKELNDTYFMESQFISRGRKIVKIKVQLDQFTLNSGQEDTTMKKSF
jgi:hypothetical protein